MTSASLIDNPKPLNPEYTPENLEFRDNLKDSLISTLGTPGQSVLLSGPKGSGKTAVTRSITKDSDRPVCYIPCTQLDTEYKALRQIHKDLVREDAGTGHHTSELQREVEKQFEHQKPAIILDQVDFLLLNDGDSLLYYLSRATGSEQTNLILTSANSTRDGLDLEERTRSSLQLQQHTIEPYTPEETFQIMARRARDALTKKSLHREALTYLSTTTQNITLGLNWLKTTAENADNVIAEETMNEQESEAYQSYVDHLLKDFSTHHELLYQAIRELLRNKDRSEIRSGPVYSKYTELCESSSEDSLSDRRISHFLKELQLLNLIQAEYHYGGQKGKTREIQLLI